MVKRNAVRGGQGGYGSRVNVRRRREERKGAAKPGGAGTAEETKETKAAGKAEKVTPKGLEAGDLAALKQVLADFKAGTTSQDGTEKPLRSLSEVIAHGKNFANSPVGKRIFEHAPGAIDQQLEKSDLITRTAYGFVRKQGMNWVISRSNKIANAAIERAKATIPDAGKQAAAIKQITADNERARAYALAFQDNGVAGLAELLGGKLDAVADSRTLQFIFDLFSKSKRPVDEVLKTKLLEALEGAADVIAGDKKISVVRMVTGLCSMFATFVKGKLESKKAGTGRDNSFDGEPAFAT